MVKKSKYSITSYSKFPFTGPLSDAGKITFNVYEKGSGPAIIIIQELPGIGQETLRLGEKLIEAGFKVVLPHFFGPLDRTSMIGNLVRVLCMRKVIHIFSSNQSSPIVNWLRELARFMAERNKLPGVGVIGMCLTGNFAISMMAEKSVLAAVASQPSLPILKSNHLHLSPEDIGEIKSGLDQNGPMLAYRFEKDYLCTKGKFKHLDQAFNDPNKKRIQLKELPGFGHSVLTLDFVEEDSGHPTQKALREVISYFEGKLM